MTAAGLATTEAGDERTGDEQIALLGMVIQHGVLLLQVAAMPSAGGSRRRFAPHHVPRSSEGPGSKQGHPIP
jgi:hypothetical protein